MPVYIYSSSSQLHILPEPSELSEKSTSQSRRFASTSGCPHVFSQPDWWRIFASETVQMLMKGLWVCGSQPGWPCLEPQQRAAALGFICLAAGHFPPQHLERFSRHRVHRLPWGSRPTRLENEIAYGDWLRGTRNITAAYFFGHINAATKNLCICRSSLSYQLGRNHWPVDSSGSISLLDGACIRIFGNNQKGIKEKQF